MKNQSLKLVFGLVIFLFSIALAYFTANYLSTNSLFDYWGTLAIFAGVYALIGIAVAFIYSISLGFLFSADALIINLLIQYYGHWADALKMTVVGVILIILYIATMIGMRDKPGAGTADLAPASTPGTNPPQTS